MLHVHQVSNDSALVLKLCDLKVSTSIIVENVQLLVNARSISISHSKNRINFGRFMGHIFDHIIFLSTTSVVCH